MKKFLSLTLLLALLLGSLWGCAAPQTPTDTTPPSATVTAGDGLFHVHYIDVGQADSILLEYEGKYALIDSGYAATGNFLVQYLINAGVEELEMVVGTHAHGDHIGGMADILEHFPVARYWSPVHYYSSPYDKLAYYADQQDLVTEVPRIGEAFFLGDVKLQLIGPLGTYYSDLNNTSLVIMAEYKNNRFLFTGDMEQLAENELMDAGVDLKADVLKVGHHGSYSSTGYFFLQQVQPSYGIISCGKDNDYGHPHSGPLSRLEAFHVETYRTDLMGTVVATSDGTNITFRWDNTQVQPSYSKRS